MMNIKNMRYLKGSSKGLLLLAITGLCVLLLGGNALGAFCDLVENEGMQCDSYGVCGVCVRTSEIGGNYTGECAVNNPPYVELDDTCMVDEPLELSANPSYAQNIYYLPSSEWTGWEGFYHSEGFDTHFSDGGSCGLHTPPPEGNRVETLEENLTCVIEGVIGDTTMEIQQNSVCSKLKIDEAVVDVNGTQVFHESLLPATYNAYFTANDNGSVGGYCYGENPLSSTRTQSITLCPGGKRELGDLSLTARGEGTNKRYGWATVSVLVPHIRTVVQPHLDYCGYPQTIKYEEMKGRGQALVAVHENILNLALEFSCNKIYTDPELRVYFNEMMVTEGPMKFAGTMENIEDDVYYWGSIEYSVKGKGKKRITREIEISCNKELRKRSAIGKVERGIPNHLRLLYEYFPQNVPVVKVLEMDDQFEEAYIDQFSYECCPHN
jgi:hypothetical protein